MAATLALPQPKTADLTDNAWQEVGWLPCRLSAQVSIEGFTVGDLIGIEVGSVVDAGITSATDVSIQVNGAHVGYGKLDAVSGRLGVRLTELV